MININTLDDSMFTVDGVSHFRKFFSNVKGDLVRVYNSFTAQNVLIDYISFDQIVLNGATYPSAITLQPELLKVIYVSDPVGVVIGQDNKLKTAFVTYTGEMTLEALKNAFNSSPTVTVSDKELLFVVASNASTGVVFKFFVNGAGKGLYGIGGTQIQSSNIQVVYSGLPDYGDIINNPTTQFVNLGDIGASTVEDYVNAYSPPLIIQDQEDGYVVFKTIISGTPVDYLFLGEGGIYGAGNLQTVAEDFQVLSSITPIPSGEKEDADNKTNNLDDANSTIKFPTFSAVTRWIKERLISALTIKNTLVDNDSIVIGDSEDLEKTKKIPWYSFKTLFKTVGGISIFGSGNIDTHTAGVNSRIYFTGDEVTTGSGTFFLTNDIDKGAIASASPTSLVLGNNVKAFFIKDLLSPALASSTIIYSGNYSANVNFSQTPAPIGTQSRFTLEIYKANNNGDAIASGIVGAPTGGLGVQVVAILDSGTINLVSGSISNVPMVGALSSNLFLNAGERLRYHLSAEKVGTGGGDVTYNAYYGNTRNSFYDIPIAVSTDSVVNRSAVAGNTATNALNSLNTLVSLKANDSSVIHKTLNEEKVGTFTINSSVGGNQRVIIANSSITMVNANGTTCWVVSNQGASQGVSRMGTANSYFETRELSGAYIKASLPLEVPNAITSAHSLNKGQFDAVLLTSVSLALDFPSTATGTFSDLPITYAGAVLGDIVTIGIPFTSVNAGQYVPFVSSAGVVTVRFYNNSGATIDPVSGTFKVKIIR